MINIFKKQSKGYTGMELSSSQLRMIELSGTDKSITIEKYAIVDIPNDIYSNHEVHDQTKLGQLIQKTFSGYGFSNKNISLALPSNLVITKEFNMAVDATEEEQKDTVQIEVQNTVPLEIDEIYIDYKVFETSKQEGTVEAAFAVSKKEHVDDRVGALEIAHLNAKIVDSEHNAMLFAVTDVIKHQLEIGQEENVLVVNTNRDKTEYLIFRAEKLVWSREHHICSQSLWDSMMNTYGVDIEDAHKMTTHPDDFEEAYPRLKVDVIQPFLDGLTLEINRHIEMFNESGTSFGVQQILISGDIASIPGIDETIQSQNDVNTLALNALAHCSLGAKINVDKLIDDAPLLTIAMGMALRTFA